MQLPRFRRKLTKGERARVASYGLVGTNGAGYGYLAVLNLDQSSVFNGFDNYHCWIVLVSALSGLVALYFAEEKFGQPGLLGALRSIAGAIWLSFTAALIGGTLSLPLYGTMFAPFVLSILLVGAPILLVVWFSNLAALHFLMSLHHRERDSIFVTKTPDQSLEQESPRPLRKAA